MSSILKALRKLEEEKAALGEGQVDIARDILKGSARRAERRLFWPLTSVILLLFLLGSVSYFYLFGSQTVEKPAAAVEASPPEKIVPQPIVVVKRRPPAETPSSLQDPKPAGAETVPQVVAKKPVVPMAYRPDGSPFVKLTGIAYRENPQERIAIVNDLPVMQGTLIEGVEVVEIHPHKVVFRWQDQNYTLNVEAE